MELQNTPRDDEGPGAVWPPPPNAPPPSPVHAVSAQMFAAGGPCADFRAGTLRLDADGLHLDGRAVVHAQIAVPLCLLGGALFCVGSLLVCLLLEIVGPAFHRHIPWDKVQRIVLVSRRERVCLVYEAPDRRDVPRLWSLTFQFTPAAYGPFVAEVERYAPGRAAEGRLHRWLPPHLWALAVTVLAVAIWLLLLAARP